MTIAEKIHILEKDCFSDPWSITSVENQLSSEQTIFAICEENGETAGFVLGTEVCGEAELYRIAVSEKFRRRGLGERLMADFLEQCRKRGAQKVFLEVRSRNLPAISLYEKAGFERIAVRKGYYGDDDAVIFAKNM